MPVSLPFPGGNYADGVFDLGRDHGFLPNRPPVAILPAPFEPVQRVLDAMPVRLEIGGEAKGLLGTPGAIAVEAANLPDLHDAVAALDPCDPDDRHLLAALFRSYAFLASAYTLEPAHQHHVEHGRYGEARRTLPAAIARPFVAAADKLQVHPWLDYHYAYSLYNWRFLDPEVEGLERYRWDNLTMCNRFSGTPDEVGFIMLHVHIDAHTGAILGSIEDALSAADAITRGEDAQPALRAALAEQADTMVLINDIRKEMWQASRWQHYNDFRVFIMGITGNEALFGPGVVYEGVERFGGEPQQFRGQTGAQDDLIPTLDVFTGLHAWYPDNELTRYLLDLRAYRPEVVRRFLEDLGEARELAALDAALATDPASIVQQMRVVEQVYQFRNGHWQFVQKYIMATTKYAVATGGTPITTWIPNQIEASLKYLQVLAARVRPHRDTLPDDIRATFDAILEAQPRRIEVLQAQIAELSKANYSAELVYDLNAELAEGPGAAAK